MPVATASVDEFLSLLEQSQLLREPILQKVREQIPTLGADANDASKVAKSLVKSQLLSAYQALRLLSGKADGFYLGKYRLLDILGQGGMGMVYLAEQITMNRLVALKVIGRISKSKDDALARFKREARAVAQLSHANIIQAYDFDEIDDIPFISMEYVEGIDVERQVAKFGPVDWKQAADYAMQAAAGLEAARQAKFVHRDIKPGNLLIDTSGTVKILDLGLVMTKQYTRNDSLTSAQDQVGTVDYMAPEQALNSHRVDTRADLYSLGGVLHFMLTGKIPFEGTSSAEKLLKHQSAAPTPVRQLKSGISEELERIVLKLLAKKADDRFQTPEELIAALKPLAEKKTPPYDAAAVKHPRATFAPLLGRGPEANAINTKGHLSGVLSPLRVEGGMAGSTGIASMQSTGVVSMKSTIEVERPLGLAEPAARNAIVKRMPSQVSPKEQPATALAKANVTKRAPARSGPKSAIVIVPNRAEQEEEDFADLPALPSSANRRRIRKSPDNSRGKSSGKDGGDAQFLMLLGSGLTATILIAGLVIFLSGGRANQTALAVTTASGTPPANAHGSSAQPVAVRGRFIRIPLDHIANTVSTKGMFNEETNDTERLILPAWTSKDVEGVPFTLIDPRNGNTPNVVMLQGALGTQAPQKPKSVSVPTSFSAKAIHLLSGVGGYCYPSQPKGSVSMIVRLTYADGSVENHELLNGEHFADYIHRIDVSGSKFAFEAGQQQMRFLSIHPQRTDRILSIELVKGPDKTAPLIMAMTLEEVVSTGNASSAVSLGPPSYERWKTYSEELRKDPDLIAYYTFSGDKDGKDVLHSQATSPKFGSMNGKVHGGARWVPGRFPQKTALQFDGQNSGHYVSLGDGDSSNCNFTTSFTVAAWFKANEFDHAHQLIVGKGDSSWRLQRDDEKHTLQLAMNNYLPPETPAEIKAAHPFARIEGLTAVKDGKWHLAIGVYDFSASRPTMTLYLDGQLEGVTKLGTPNQNQHPVMIGANSEKFSNNEFRYWKGLIDEVVILNRAFKAADAELMYDAGRPMS